MTRRALLAALALALAFTAGLAIGRAGAAVPSHPVYVGPYTAVRIATPRGSALPVTEPSAEPTPSGAAPAVRGHKVSGVPTWFCRAGVSRCTHGYPDGPGLDLYAAAGPSLRVGAWRGRVVTVCAARCIRVTLRDWCLCGAPHFLDLTYDAWVTLGRPGRATVTW